MPITPDTKDWTFVLERTCEECGFDVTGFPREEIGSMIRSNGIQWASILEHPKAKERPSEDRWSALEYACHVRDVYRLYDERLRLMLEQNDPSYPNWDQDEAAIAQDYPNQDPEKVEREIVEAAEQLATRYDTVEGDAWKRTGNRSDGVRFTVESFARYLIHDPVHHLHDADKGYEILDRKG
jgi:hypothetical protein